MKRKYDVRKHGIALHQVVSGNVVVLYVWMEF